VIAVVSLLLDPGYYFCCIFKFCEENYLADSVIKEQKINKLLSAGF
jgi:hypothetical protein